jgi:hypothetical protein
MERKQELTKMFKLKGVSGGQWGEGFYEGLDYAERAYSKQLNDVLKRGLYTEALQTVKAEWVAQWVARKLRKLDSGVGL